MLTVNFHLMGNWRKSIEKNLGLDLPKDYFSKSKINILEKVSIKKEVKLKYFTETKINLVCCSHHYLACCINSI